MRTEDVIKLKNELCRNFTYKGRCSYGKKV